MPRLAANLSWLYGDRPFSDRFAAAAASGFRGVECLFPYELPAHDLAGLLDAAGVELALFNLAAGDWAAGERGLAALPGRETDFAASVEQARRYAGPAGTRRVHAMAGIVPEGADRARWIETYIANLRRAAGALAEDGVTLLIEPINGRDMPGYLLSTLDQALTVVEQVGAPNLKVQADLYHLQITGGDLTRRLAVALPWISHVQVAGVPDRAEPDRGELRHESLFAMLDDAGYDGWVGCEYRPAGRTEDGLGWASHWLDPQPKPGRQAAD